MKTILIVIVFLLPISASAITCPAGQIEWQNGCTEDLKPEIAQPVQPSDEKPPEEKMPSYERPGANIVDAPSTGDADAKADQDKRDADAQGKQSAGIKPQ